MSETLEFQEPLIVRFTGCMDTVKCAEMEAEVLAALADAIQQPIVFDLDGVDFVSSAFLRLCILAQRRVGDYGFRIINVCPMVKRVFKIAGLDGML